MNLQLPVASCQLPVSSCGQAGNWQLATEIQLL